VGSPLSKLVKAGIAFASTPKGQRMIKQAVAKAKDPATRAKVQQMANQAKARGAKRH
jgi:hypothetical protein